MIFPAAGTKARSEVTFSLPRFDPRLQPHKIAKVPE